MDEEARVACLLAGFGVDTGAGVDGRFFGLLGGNGDACTGKEAEVDDGFCMRDALFDLVETPVAAVGNFSCCCKTTAVLLDTDF